MKVAVLLVLAGLVASTAGALFRAKPDKSPGWQKRAGLTISEYEKAKNKIKVIKKLHAGRRGRVLMDSEIPDNNRIGDIAFTSHQAEYMYQRLISKPRRRWKRKVADPAVYSKWTTNPIDYSFEEGKFSDAQKAIIRLGIKSWQDNTCLSFQEIQSGSSTTSHLEFVDDGSGSCYSYIGMSFYGRQVIQMADWCSEWVGYIIHEVGHALLLDHEHQRLDREPYITIIENMVDPRAVSQFELTDLPNILDDQIPFDYGSVMMYSSRAATLDALGGRTIETKNPLNQQTLGQPVESSFFDTKAINIVYCPNTCSFKTCSRYGYADPSGSPSSCTSCRCPDGFGGDTCDTPAPSSTGCSPAGGVIQVISTTEQCLESPYYSTDATYPSESYCAWHLQASAGASISVRFVGDFGTLCRDNIETCAHWVEIKNDAGLRLRGFRFCCTGTPSAVLTATGEMMVIFNAKYSAIPASAPSSLAYYRGFKLCYKLETGGTTPSTTPPTTTEPCPSNPCQNGGSCYALSTGYYCYCVVGYTGNNCEIGGTTPTPPPCDSNPCQNGGSCYTQTTGYLCVCAAGNSGINCETGGTTPGTTTTTTDPCISNPCQNGGSCYGLSTGHYCYCVAGYTGNNCEIGGTTTPPQPCVSNPCQNGGSCYTQTTGYLCVCAAGYTGSNCQTGGTTPGTTTTTTDPCISNPCQNGGSCYGLSTGHYCYCVAGYTGNNCEIGGTTTPPQPCVSNPCQNGGSCYTQTTGYLCVCAAGYTGSNCQIGGTTTPPQPCVSNPCQNGGSCYTQTTGYLCVCAAGYTGSNCQIGGTTTPPQPCDSNPCQNGGSCYTQTTGYLCLCAAGYSGIHCEIGTDPCSPNPCQYGGTCIVYNNMAYCSCVSPRYGDRCQFGTDPCSPNPCQYGGTCIVYNNMAYCSCVSPRYGDRCQFGTDPCSPNPCQYGGTCIVYNNMAYCSCVSPRYGDRCQFGTDPCSPNPCQYGGTCIVYNNMAYCSCVSPRYGDRCQYP